MNYQEARKQLNDMTMMDSSLMIPGEDDFNDLNDCYIIIISPIDILKLGYYRYTFRMRCDEAMEQSLEDGSVRIFLNTKGSDESTASQELIELLHYFQSATGDSKAPTASEKLKRLHERIQDIRTSEKVGVKYMQLWEERMEDRKEARAEGRIEGRNELLEELIKKKLAKGKTLEQIAEELEESIEVIQSMIN